MVATHSPMITAGAGPDSLTYRFVFDGSKTTVNEIKDLAFMSVDNILASPAFSLVSPFSPQTQLQLEKYLRLKKKHKLSPVETKEYQATLPFVEKAYASLPEVNDLESRIDQFLKMKLP